ncbi:MAG: hypothetical protein M1817_002326 [Caeruleum heppii]|nr:MAG: hypothetical protein M1817_003489 [Caeruleum heppii]KAI9673688.1 MAG: hypothetical protein M1817_002326 [Caeruleum heppii]
MTKVKSTKVLKTKIVGTTEHSLASPVEMSAGVPSDEEVVSSKSSPSPPPSPPRKRKRDAKAVEELEIDIAAPVPPSKKALRKAKKLKVSDAATGKLPNAAAKTKRSTPPRSSDDENPDKTVGGVAKELQRSEHGIWIGNLPFNATKADLQDFLTGKSTITEDQISRVHLPGPSGPAPAPSTSARNPKKPQNRGFAYIDFSDASALQQALGLSETLVKGRRVLIKNSKSFEGRPPVSKDTSSGPGKGKSGKPPNTRIFVGNLGFDTTEEDLRTHFERCGEIVDLQMATFEDSGKCKGFSWVRFKELEASEAAVRGWVKIPADDVDDSESGPPDDESESGEPKPEKKVRLRKWWVNRMRGRPLRMEYAEDATARYKKRYGKDRPSKEAGDETVSRTEPERTAVPGKQRGDDSAPYATSSKAADGSDGGAFRTEQGIKSGTSSVRRERKVDARTIKPGAALAGAQRSTGAIIPGTGKKTTFA